MASQDGRESPEEELKSLSGESKEGSETAVFSGESKEGSESAVGIPPKAAEKEPPDFDPEATGSKEKVASSSLLNKIENLKAEQKAVRTTRVRVTKDLKNAERRRKRLKLRAKALSEGDLKDIMGMRAVEASAKQVLTVASTEKVKNPTPSLVKSKKGKKSV